MSRKRSDNDPVSYGDFVALRVEVERRITALETQQASMKEDIGELKKSMENVKKKMEELKDSIQEFMSKIGESRRKDMIVIVTSIIGGTIAATLIALVIKMVAGM